MTNYQARIFCYTTVIVAGGITAALALLSPHESFYYSEVMHWGFGMIGVAAFLFLLDTAVSLKQKQ